MVTANDMTSLYPKHGVHLCVVSSWVLVLGFGIWGGLEVGSSTTNPPNRLW